MSTMSPDKLARLNDLLVASAAGDTHAFSEFYDALAPLVYDVTLHVLRNPALAEEVAQDVFVEVWSKAAHFDPARGSARTWVGRIAHGRAALRGDDVETDALDRVESQRLRAAAAAIGEPHSTAVELAFFGGLTHAELAESTGVPMGTAKTRVRDGVRKLKELMAREER